MFREMEVLAARLYNFLYFRGEFEKPENQTKKPAQSCLLINLQNISRPYSRIWPYREFWEVLEPIKAV